MSRHFTASDLWGPLLRWFPKAQEHSIVDVEVRHDDDSQPWVNTFGYASRGSLVWQDDQVNSMEANQCARQIRRAMELMHLLYQVDAQAWRDLVGFHWEVDVPESGEVVPILEVHFAVRQESSAYVKWFQRFCEALLCEEKEEEQGEDGEEYKAARDKLAALLPEVESRRIEVKLCFDQQMQVAAKSTTEQGEDEENAGDTTDADADSGREAEPTEQAESGFLQAVRSAVSAMATVDFVNVMEKIVTEYVPHPASSRWMGNISLDMDYRSCQKFSSNAKTKLMVLAKTPDLRLSNIHLLIEEPKGQINGQANELHEFTSAMKLVASRARHIEATVSPDALQRFRSFCEAVVESNYVNAVTINVLEANEVEMKLHTIWEDVLRLISRPSSIRAVTIRDLPLTQNVVDTIERMKFEVASPITSLRVITTEGAASSKNAVDACVLLRQVQMPDLQLLHITGATISSECVDYILRQYPRLRCLQLDEVSSSVLSTMFEPRATKTKLARLRLRIGRRDSDCDADFHAFLGALAEAPPYHLAHLSELTLDQDGHHKALTMRDMTPLFLLITRNISLQNVNIHVHERAADALKMLARVVKGKKDIPCALSLSRRLALLSALQSRHDLMMLDQDAIMLVMDYAGCYVKRTVDTG